LARHASEAAAVAFRESSRAYVDLITMPVQKSEIRNKFEARKLDPPQANRNLTRSLAF